MDTHKRARAHTHTSPFLALDSIMIRTVYFLGLTEFSSIFLVFVDLAKYFPPVEGTLYDMVVGICGPLFAVSFYTYRVFLWAKVGRRLALDSMHVIKNGTAEKLRPGKVYVIYLFLVSCFLLFLLQLYWGYLVGLAVVDVIA